MQPVLYTLTSPLHSGMAPDARQEPFIQDIEAALGVEFDCRGDDFSDYGAGPSSFAATSSSFAGLTGEPSGPEELIYVRTGGTEGLFLKLVGDKLKAGRQRSRVKPGMTQEKGFADGPAGDKAIVRLLASGQSNSLAASMEILAWLQRNGFGGEILHGSPAAIAARLRAVLERPNNIGAPGAEKPSFAPRAQKNESPGAKRPDFALDTETGSPASVPGETKNVIPGALEGHFAPGDEKNDIPGALEGHFAPGGGKFRLGGRNDGEKVLEGKRFGVIGRPSDWLIASEVDYDAARQVLGAELIDIPIDELVAEAQEPVNEEILRQAQDDRRQTQEPLSLKPLNIPRYGRPISEKDWRGALAIYEALKRLVQRYRLDGLTLRCFDLLSALHNTGCLALAILGSEGITATCEGDIPAMLTMAVARELSGGASFQVNLSRIEDGRLLFAHCTVPLSIVRDYCYDTHFESGIGVAIHGELPEGPVTLFKIAPDLQHFVSLPGRIVKNTYADRLCRTQVLVEAPGAADYLLKAPLGNHHILVPGKL